MINVLQKVTTFPIELIDLPIISSVCNIPSNDIHKYYSTLLQISVKGPLIESELNEIKTTPEAYKNDMKIKQRFITYNAIYDKIFSNNLNVLEKNNRDENTVVVFPIHQETDMGKIDLNPIGSRYYGDKFIRIKKDITFQNQKPDQPYQPFCYIGLSVFRSETKEDYKNAIKNQFEDIKKIITDYNKSIQSQIIGLAPRKPIQNILFILDGDKKGLFTGFYNKQLSKEKQDILNKEYENFLNSSSFRRGRVDDNGMNMTFSDVIKQAKWFKQNTTIGIGDTTINTAAFNSFMAELKEKYKKITDKEYKKSLELKDNVEELKVYYKIENADKLIEDKIQTGSNKLYTIYISPDNKHNIVGFFVLVSEARGIYRFKEDIGSFKKRKSVAQNNEITNNNIEKEDDEVERSEALDFAVEIKYKYGIFKYKNLNVKKDKKYKKYKNVLQGDAVFLLDKTEAKFKWFNLKDIDASFLDKNVIKYYPTILFDKKTLVEYLKSKQKYSDKTVLSYEFLKINDSPELSEYCDFIHTKFKSNIIDDSYSLFKINFDVNVIIKNILDIVFESNTPIYIRTSKKTTDDKREASNDSYKIVEYKLHDIEDDKTCETSCQTEYKNYNNTKRSLIVVVTKTNIKDIAELKSKTTCKTKKTKLIYDYKQLFANVTRRIGFGYFGGTRKKSESRQISRQRRLKAKRYK